MTIKEGWIAAFSGGTGERTYQTYVYKKQESYGFICSVRTTTSYGSPKWIEEITDTGTVETKEDILRIAENYRAEIMMLPGDDTIYQPSDFLEMDNI